MKPALKSKTIGTAITIATASVTSLVLHYCGVVALAPETLGAAWSTVVSSVLMVVLRLVTREPIGSEELKDKAEETE